MVLELVSRLYIDIGLGLVHSGVVVDGIVWNDCVI